MDYIYDLADIPQIAKAVFNETSNKILIFKGPMGVGKTTFIKEAINLLGVTATVTSPTFSLVNEYEVDGKLIYHFDLYRIDSAQEAMDIGFDEYLINGSYVFIEWPEKIVHLLPEKFTEITIETIKNKKRKLSTKEISEI